MPLGKVFDASENQVLFSPVSNYYAGKKKRQDLAIGEKTLGQMDDKLDLETRRVETDEGNLEARIDEYGREVGKDKALEEANIVIGITDGAKSILDAGGTTEKALAYANERMTDLIDSLPKGSKGRLRLEELQENGFQPEELTELRSFALAMNKQFATDSTTNPFAKINPKDYTQKSIEEFQRTEDFSVLEKAPSSEKEGFEPISAGERAAALAVVKSIPALADLSDNDRLVAAEMISNDIRQLQANQGKSYEEALAIAITNVVVKVIKDPKFFSGRDSKLRKLEDNEYLVDGKVFIKDESGIRPKP